MAIKIAKTKQRSPTPDTHPHDVGPQDLPSVVWPVEQWLQFQAELLKATTPGWTHWLDRRFEGLTATLHAAEKFASCREIGEVVAIQSEWLDGAIKRLDLDSQGLIAQALAVSQCTAGATRQIAQTTTEITTRGAEWVVHRGADLDPSLAGIKAAPNGAPRVVEDMWRHD